MPVNTPPAPSVTDSETAAIIGAQQAFFATGVTRSFAFRKAQLLVLKNAIKRQENAIMDALKADLGKSAFESYMTEIGLVYTEIDHAISKLRQWMQPRKVATPFTLFPSRSYIYPQPVGTVLIIAPWNYPFQLMVMPLVAAIAAGNTVILKPSEFASETEMLLNTLIGETFEQEYIAVVNVQGPQLSDTIRNHHFDHIFFTGSTRVGSLVMEAAARQLSPVTLELGGKSPCIVTQHAHLEWAAKKIAWSKWMNAGQICVAPDYLLVHESVCDKLLPLLVKRIQAMFGKDPQQSPDYGRLIHQKHWDHVHRFLADGTVYHGGRHHRGERYLEPTILTGVSLDAPVMQEEVFGPILPVITYKTEEEALAIIARNPYPLACYIYSQKSREADYFIENVRFGGGAVNNGLVHLSVPELPFGGVGYSGMGAYHGKKGFDCFTHNKTMVKTPTWMDVPIIYPPYKDHLKWLKKLIG